MMKHSDDRYKPRYYGGNNQHAKTCRCGPCNDLRVDLLAERIADIENLGRPPSGEHQIPVRGYTVKPFWRRGTPRINGVSMFQRLEDNVAKIVQRNFEHHQKMESPKQKSKTKAKAKLNPLNKRKTSNKR